MSVSGRQSNCHGVAWLFRCTWICTLTMVSLTSSKVWAQPSDLLQQLTSDGLSITSQQKITLPAPIRITDLPADQQAAALEKLAGNVGWERFSRKSAVAPVAIELEYLRDTQDQKIGHNIHSVFAVHSKLETLRDQELMKQIFGQPENQQSDELQFKPLTKDELTEVGLAPQAENSPEFARIQLVLLEKILVKGIVRIEKIESPAGLTMAWILEDRFPKNANWSATWQRRESGDGPSVPQAYSGCGGYLFVNQVTPDILIIESRMILHEPEDWFSGSNFVRSKLPLVIQEGARSFRRKLAQD